MGIPSTTGCPSRLPRENVSISPMSPSHWNRPCAIFPPKTGASQSPSAASRMPPMMVLLSTVCGMKIVKPRRMNRKASVTMKLGRPVRITIQPFSAPIETHMAKVTPIIEPTERSNSPAIISRQAPTAMIMNWADTTVQFMMPCGANMPLSNANSKKKRNTRTVPHIPPSSGRISARRHAGMSLTRSSAIPASSAILRPSCRCVKGPGRPWQTPRTEPQRYSPANSSTLARPEAVTKPGPELMLLPGRTP